LLVVYIRLQTFESPLDMEVNEMNNSRTSYTFMINDLVQINSTNERCLYQSFSGIFRTVLKVCKNINFFHIE